MGPACQAFFNANLIYDKKPCLESFADKCLSPVRCLFNGREVKKIGPELSYPDRSAGQIALAVLLFIPAIIFGTLAKLFSMVYSQTREHQQLLSLSAAAVSLSAAAAEVQENDIALLGRIFKFPLVAEKMSAEQKEDVNKFIEIIPKLEVTPDEEKLNKAEKLILTNLAKIDLKKIMNQAMFD
jgi:hypothetical protein